MKKHLLFVSASVLLTALTAKAQITITQNDLPTIGMVVYQGSDTIYTGLSYGNAGASQTWNLANLVTHTKDTTTFVAPGPLTGSGSFPTSNIGSVNGTSNTFYYVSASTLDLLGMYTDFGPPLGFSTIKFNPALTHITLPATYNMTPYVGATNFVMKFAYSQPPVDSMKITVAETYTNSIDGWGTVTTPAYSNVSCLRENIRTFQTNTTYIHTVAGWAPTGSPTTDTTFAYSWWSNTKKYPLAELDANAAGAITSAQYLLQTGVVGVHESASAQNKLLVYPNPAVDHIIISGNTEISSIVISDVTGKLVSTVLLQNNRTTINVSDYENGIYLYQVVNKSGTTIGKGKFVVAK